MNFDDKTFDWGVTGTMLRFTLVVALSAFFFGGIGFQFAGALYPQNDPGYLRLSQFSLSLGLFVMPPLLLALWANAPAKAFFQFSPLVSFSPEFSKKNQPKTPYATLLLWLGLGLIVLSCFALIDLLSLLNQWILAPFAWGNALIELSNANNVMIERLFQPLSPSVLAANVLIMVLLPAFGEELFFRGFVQKIVGRSLGMHGGVTIAALSFALVHNNPAALLPILFMGFVLGYSKVLTKSLWAPVLIHLTNNAITLVSTALNGGKMTADVQPSHWSVYLGAALLFSLGFALVHRFGHRERA